MLKSTGLKNSHEQTLSWNTLVKLRGKKKKSQNKDHNTKSLTETGISSNRTWS